MLLTVVALSLVAAAPEPVDLDGDGTPEVIRIEPGQVMVGTIDIPCHAIEETCYVEVHDMLATDKRKELALCQVGGRGEHLCRFFRFVKGEAIQVEFPADPTGTTISDISSIHTNGSGNVLVDEAGGRLVTRRKKHAWNGKKLTFVRQPLYAADPANPGTRIDLDLVLDVRFAPLSNEIVARAAANSIIVLLGEHGEKSGWYLVRTATGLTGWVDVESLQTASKSVMARMSAG